MRSAPDVRRFVGVCMACRHWQADVRPGAVSDLGGSRPALMALAELHATHLPNCPGSGGRVKFKDRWVERPAMSDGRPADGLLEMTPLPTWWVTR